jgi:hypothetical protein
VSDQRDEDMALLKKLWDDDFGWCYCGEPGTVMETIRDVLRQRVDYFSKIRDDPWPAPANREDPPDGVYASNGLEWVLEYVMDKAELTEHGGNVSGAWLTPKGEDALAALERLDLEEDDFLLDDPTS